MKAYGSPHFLTPLTGLVILLAMACPAGMPPAQAYPLFADAASPQEDLSDNSGSVSSPEDDLLPTDYLLGEARSAVEKRDFIIAEALYQTVLLRERNHVAAILELAAVYEQTGKLEYARGLLLRATVLRPHDEKIIALSKEISDLLSTVLIEEVDSLIANNQCELALPKLSMLLTIEPENPDLYFKKAICHLRLDKTKTALICIDDALRLQKNTEYFNLRADITEQMKSNEINGLIGDVQSLMVNNTPANRQQALRLIGDILRIAPEHPWAKQSFVNLSNGETPSMESAGSKAKNGASAQSGDAAAGNPSGISALFASFRDYRTMALLLAPMLAAAFLVVVILSKFKRATPVHPLCGRFSHFSLKDILGLVNSSSRTGVLRITSKFINGEIFFNNGEACHSKAGSLVGVEAVSFLLDKTKAGLFHFVDCPPSPERTIASPLTSLIADPDPRVPVNAAQEPTPAKSRKPRSRMKQLLDSKN
ncbi:MAG: DUF4388 domain-containing protein [Candidatus Latescibacterota bacterium]